MECKCKDGAIVGRENLKKLYPLFEEDVAENGIDLRVGVVEKIIQDGSRIGCVNDKKYKPNYEIVEPKLIDGEEIYELEPQTYYFITVDRVMDIPEGYCQLYYIRSTFARAGLQLISAVGDNGYSGTLMMGVYNTNPINKVSLGVNERLIQAVTYTNDGSASVYDGSYQNDEFYKE